MEDEQSEESARVGQAVAPADGRQQTETMTNTAGKKEVELHPAGDATLLLSVRQERSVMSVGAHPTTGVPAGALEAGAGKLSQGCVS